MASLPKKGVKGANLRKWLIDSIEQLIDYLHSTRVLPGDGIMVKETPAGVIVSLAKKSTSTVNNSTGGGGGGGTSGLFPTYAIVTIPSIVPGTTYSADQDFYIIGWIKQNTGGAIFAIANETESAWLSIPVLSSASSPDSSSPVCFPVPANRKFYVSGLDYYEAGLGAYGTTSTAVTLTSY